MGVGAAHAEGADTDTAIAARAGQRPRLGRDVERAAGEVDGGVRGTEVGTGGYGALPGDEDAGDEPGDAGRGVQVADGRLEGADGAVPAPVGGVAERLGEGLDLDRIAECGARAVGFDVADGVGRHTGVRVGLGDHLALAAHAGRGEADLVAAVVVEGRAQDHRVDVVAVADGVGQALEEDHAGAAAPHGAVGGAVEGAAGTARGIDAVGGVEIALSLGHLEGDPAGERQVALVGLQAARGEVDGGEGGRAGRADGDARSAQSEPVGDAGGEEVLVVVDEQGQSAEGPCGL